jgi:hypothetical protein
MKALQSELAERVLRAGVRIEPGKPFDFDGVTYTPVVMRAPPRHRKGAAMTVLYDLSAAIKEAVREFKRLRWRRQHSRQISLPF